ncbi:MAG TPA: alpha/beta hydrolase [Acidimicrobiales bacterium]|jgi:putative redox protein|nr:alpha/beta hydrolase [Acidimicrobiales bacterium]
MSEVRFPSEGFDLAGNLAMPSALRVDLPGVVVCHGYPSGPVRASGSGATYPELASRIAEHIALPALAFRFRGCNGSSGNFSMAGWLTDVHAAIDYLRAESGVTRVLVAGFGTGGALGICAGAARDDVSGVAALGAPADFDDWANHPRRLVQHARDVGAVHDKRFPLNFDAWARELREIRPVEDVAHLAPRPLLVVHGSDDEAVPHFDARVLSDAHGSAELRILAGAGHATRHDPRAIAILIGWLERQKDPAGAPAARP